MSAPIASDVQIFADQTADGTYEATPTLAVPVTDDPPAGAAEVGGPRLPAALNPGGATGDRLADYVR